MRKKDHYNVLAVYSLLDLAGRENFSGVLDAIPNTNTWHLSTVRPGRFFSVKELFNEKGEPYDGLILSLPGTDSVMAEIARLHTPTVLVNITDRRLSARSERVSSVWLDNADIGRRAARHLLERGEYRSAGYVHEIGHPFYSDERMMAFRAAMKQKRIETSVFQDDETTELPASAACSGKASSPMPPRDPERFFRRLRAWVKELPKPAAVMACSDMRAADIINACKSEDIKVPAQMAVVGVDYDVSQHSKCGMSISSVIHNPRMMGRKAVQELDFLFRHPKWNGRPHEVLIPAASVFSGESTAWSASTPRLVSNALEFIAANRMRRLTPSDVFAHLGCSRQLANLRFAQVGEATIGQAIEKARMEEAQSRLQRGEAVADIVKAMDFTSANQFYRIYKRHFGRTTSSRASGRS